MRLATRQMAMVIALGVLPVLPASAQTIIINEYATATPPEKADGDVTDELRGSHDEQALRDALNYDPTATTVVTPAPKLRMPGAQGHGFNMSRTDNADGSSAVTLRQPLPTEWDTKIGADIGLAASPAATYSPLAPQPGDQTSGAAWASVGVGIASIDARVDPLAEQGKLGTTFRRSVPVGGDATVTLQDSYSVTESFAPVTDPNASTQVWGTEKQVKFNLPTGTSFGAGVAANTGETVTHNSLSASQQLYGPLAVTGAVNDIDQPTSSKSISAGFKLNW